MSPRTSATSPNPAKPGISRLDITDHARRASDLTSATWSDSEAPVRIGLFDHCSEYDIHMPSGQALPHLSLVLLLEGQGHFSMGHGAPCQFRGGYCFLSCSWERFDCHDFIPARTRFRGVNLRYPLPWRFAIGNNAPASHAGCEVVCHPRANAWLAALPMTAAQSAFAEALCKDGLPTQMLEVLDVQASALRILHDMAGCLNGDTLGTTEKNQEQSKTAISRRDRRRLMAARRHIDAHSGERLPLAAIALAANMSVTALTQGFSAAFGLSVHTYVIESRCHKAADLLRNAQLSVEEVAMRCGFSGASHLSRHFKQLFHKTPLQYRHGMG